MGFPIALNLRKYLPENSTLYVYDVVRDKSEQFKLQAQVEAEPKAATAAETQFTLAQAQNLPDNHHVDNSDNVIAEKVIILNSAREVADNSVGLI